MEELVVRGVAGGLVGWMGRTESWLGGWVDVWVVGWVGVWVGGLLGG